jgi:hypothetical protein
MNHQPFKDWLLSNEKLTTGQTQALQDHLLSCESCRAIETAWTEVEMEFNKIPQVMPAPGFSKRWQANLAAYQLRSQKQRGWLTIGFTGLIITILLALTTIQLWSFFQAPGPFLTTWFLQLVNLVSIYFTIQEIIESIPGSLSIYTFIGAFFLVGMASFMSVLWLATYRKLIMARRQL